MAAEKQAFDLALARAALDGGLPVLGICYGMQLLALAEGAELHQHLPDDRPDAREHGGGVVHPVLVEPETKLREVLGVASVDVVSRHHQALSSTGPLWRICGRDDQGTIEAIERMRRHKVSCLPVVDGDQKLVGIVSERDFIQVTARLLDEVLRGDG